MLSSRRFRRWPSVWTLLAASAIPAAIAWSWWSAGLRGAAGVAVSAAGAAEVVLRPGPCEIVCAIDGQTLLVSQWSHLFQVRLLGVETVEAGGPPAAALAELAPPGAATIELDLRRAAADDYWLAWVYAGDTLVNAAVVRAGAARYEPHPGDSPAHSRELKAAESQARREKRGIWRNASP